MRTAKIGPDLRLSARQISLAKKDVCGKPTPFLFSWRSFFFSFTQTVYNSCKLFVQSALINVFPFILRSSLSSLSWFSIRHIATICMRIDTYMGMLFSRRENLPLNICAWNNVQIQIGLLNINNNNNNNNNNYKSEL